MLLLLFVIFSTAILIIAKIHPFSEEAIKTINKKATTWKAGRNFYYDDWDRYKKMANGSSIVTHSILEDFTINPHDDSKSVPEYFDSRVNWPNCRTIREISDQSHCGSCWAVSVTSTISDRICIYSNQTKEIYVSADDLISCCLYCPGHGPGYGCNGGYVSKAWHYWKKFGIVTGGPYGSYNGCKTYSLKPCGQKKGACDKVYRKERWLCKQQCYTASLSYKESLTFGKNLVHLNREKQIQLEILKNGPVVSSFRLYDDFAHYKSGIYIATTDKETGYYAVKVIGWGVDNGVPYWLCANSWNTRWGDKGFFKILRGKNHYDLEYAFAAVPISFT